MNIKYKTEEERRLAVKEQNRKCRLVAMTWIPNPDNKPEIDHINTIRDDDRVVNLRWCTSKENKNNPLTLKKMSDANKGMFGHRRV